MICNLNVYPSSNLLVFFQISNYADCSQIRLDKYYLAMASPALDIASTIQSASLNRHPSPAHDVNPSTAASQKLPVSPITSIFSGENSIPYSALKPVPRRSNLPPLPDLRFEQSYLASLRGVEGWGGILWVTGRDQVCRVRFFRQTYAFKEKKEHMGLSAPDSAPLGAGYALDAWLGRMALLE